MYDLEKDLAELTQLVRALSDSLAAQVRKLGMVTKALILAVVLALGAVGFSFVQLARLNATNARLSEIQTRTSDQVLCPFYTIMLQSYNPKSVAARENPAEYEFGFTTIEQGAKALQCAKTERGH